jgi:predicted nucleic acid-binding protein
MSTEQAQDDTKTAETTHQDEMSQFATEAIEDGKVVEAKEVETASEDAAKETPGTPVEGGETAEEPRRTVQERINELTRGRRDAERRAQELEARLARLETGSKPAEEAKPAVDAEPDPADTAKYPYGELDKNYLRDFASHSARQEHKRLLAADAEAKKQEKVQAEQNDVRSKITAMVTRGDKKYEDFQDAINEASAAGAQLTPDLALLVAESEVGEDVVYHLAKNPAEAKALVAQGPLAMAKAFGKLEARFEKTAEKPKAKTTGAPPPPAHNARGSNGRFAATADTDDFAAFEASAMGR